MAEHPPSTSSSSSSRSRPPAPAQPAAPPVQIEFQAVDVNGQVEAICNKTGHVRTPGDNREIGPALMKTNLS